MIGNRFWRDESGNIAIIFALCLSVLLGIAGLAVDYAVAVDRKRSLDMAMDAAILAAVVAASDAKFSDRADWVKVGTDTAKSAFAANLPPKTNYQTKSFDPVVTFDDGQIVVRGSYAAQSSTSFMSLFGKNEVALQGSASGSARRPNFIDIHFLIDGSASMGIGAEAADQKIMTSAMNCAFACHQGGPNERPQAARNAGAKLRIDVVKDAIRNVITEIKSKRPASGTVRISLYVFSKTMVTLSAPTTDLDVAYANAAKIDLVSGTGGSSYISNTLKDLASKLSVAGDGSSANSRQSYVVFLSDGIDDSATTIVDAQGNWAGFDMVRGSTWVNTTPIKQASDKSWMQAFSPQGCTTMKANKHKVLSIQIKYLLAAMRPPPEPDQDKARFITNDLAAPLVNAFKACATDPGTDYVIAPDLASIAPVLNKIVNDVILPTVGRLSH